MYGSSVKIHRISLAFATLFASVAAHAQVASFDCAKAATPTEHAICRESALGRKDVTVANYFQLLLRLKPATAGMAYREFDDRVRDEQRQWLTQRDACGGDTTCLRHSYDTRIDALLKTFDGNAALTFGRTFD